MIQEKSEPHVARNFAKNAFFKALGEVAIRLLSFAFIVLVARVLGDEQFGVINFAYSFALLFVVIIDFGFNPLMVRDSARTPEQTTSLFFNLLALKFGLAMIFIMALAIGLSLLAPGQNIVQITFWLATFVMLNSFTEFICAVFHGHQKMQHEALAMVAQKLTLLLIGIGVIALGWGLVGVAMAYAMAGSIGLITAAGLLVKGGFLKSGWKISWPLISYALKQAFPLTLTTLFINIYFRIDMTILTKLTNTQQVGWYGAAHKCIEVMMVIPAVLVLAAFPTFSKLYQENKEQLARAAVKILRLLLLLGLPIAVGSMLIGEPLMILIFGQEYQPSGMALGYLSIALCFVFLNYALSYFLISAEKQKVNAIVAGCATVISVGSNLLLIPKYGYLGAAGAAIITELFLFVAYYRMVNRLVFKIEWRSSLLKIISAAVVMGSVVWFIKNASPFISIPVGILSYSSALWLFKAVEEDDLTLIKKALRK